MEMLTAKQVAEVKGCSYRYIKRIIKDGKLRAVESLNDKNKMTYLIPLNELDETLQLRWYQKNMEPEAAVPDNEEPVEEIDQFTQAEREEIDFWIGLLEQWDDYRKRPGVTSKASVDEAFVSWCKLEYPDKSISIDTLYRKRKALKQKDFGGLVDKRGKWKKGKSTIPEPVWQAFLYYYLDQSQPSIEQCIGYAKDWTREKQPELYTEIPGYHSFYRKVQRDILYGVKVLGREGEKAFDDKCGPYIRRVYDDLRSNEWWIADNHTFDVFIRDPDGTLYRPHLTAFLDARSGIFTGWYITRNPCSDATLIALRAGILSKGLPENIYVDNGREFLNHDIGGLGHRQRKKKEGVELHEPPGVFKRLGISMTNAIVRNAKAKIIERRFRDVKDHLSKLFETYTGGTVLEKPERLKYVLKKDAVYTEAEFKEIVEQLIEWHFNLEPYNGAVTADRGKAKLDVFHEHLTRQRKAAPEELSLMLMRSSRIQTVGRRGVHLDIAGGRIDYWNDDFVQLMQKEKVYYRYDPEDLSEIRVYDLEDKFIMTVPAADNTVLSYNASKEDVKEAMQTTRRLKKIQKEYMENIMIADCDRITAMDLALARAKRNKEAYQGKADPDVVELQRAVETPLFKKVVGEADLDIMNKNAARKQEGQDYE